MAEEASRNGRWWRTPSFSVEDIIKWAMLMGPLALFWATLWIDVRDIKQSMKGVATKRWVGALVRGSNSIHSDLDRRLDKLERNPHTPLPPLRVPDKDDELESE